MAEHELLCLKCRGKGHVVRNRLLQIWQGEHDWIMSKGRMSMDFSLA